MEVKQRAVAATLLSSLFWGSSFPVIAYGVTLANPVLFLFLRFMIAAPMALIIMTAFGIDLRRPLLSSAVWFLGFLNAMAFIMQYVAQTWTTATNAALFINLYIIFVGAGSVMFLKEKITWRLGAAIGLGIFGTALIETQGGTTAVSWETFRGDLLSLLAGLIWSIYIILSKVLLMRSTKTKAITPEQLTGGVCLTTLMPLFLILPFTNLGTIHNFPNLVLTATYLAIFTTILAYLLWYKGLKTLSATVTSVLVLLEVAFAAIISFIFLGDRFSTGAAFGGVIICIGAFLAATNTKD
jgi:drug/metabolite transporter (DMT)-like permease